MYYTPELHHNWEITPILPIDRVGSSFMHESVVSLIFSAQDPPRVAVLPMPGRARFSRQLNVRRTGLNIYGLFG